jgi:hypothetical protein
MAGDAAHEHHQGNNFCHHDAWYLITWWLGNLHQSKRNAASSQAIVANIKKQHEWQPGFLEQAPMPCGEDILRQAELAVSVMIEIWYLAWGTRDEHAGMQTAGLPPGLVKSSGCCTKVAKIDLQNTIIWTTHNLDREVRWTYAVQVDWQRCASTASSGETWKRKQFQLWWYYDT